MSCKAANAAREWTLSYIPNLSADRQIVLSRWAFSMIWTSKSTLENLMTFFGGPRAPPAAMLGPRLFHPRAKLSRCSTAHMHNNGKNAAPRPRHFSTSVEAESREDTIPCVSGMPKTVCSFFFCTRSYGVPRQAPISRVIEVGRPINPTMSCHALVVAVRPARRAWRWSEFGTRGIYPSR